MSESFIRKLNVESAEQVFAHCHKYWHENNSHLSAELTACQKELTACQKELTDSRISARQLSRSRCVEWSEELQKVCELLCSKSRSSFLSQVVSLVALGAGTQITGLEERNKELTDILTRLTAEINIGRSEVSFRAAENK